MQERIFRFGIAGITFLLAILFGFWYFGGNIYSVFFDEKIEVIITSIVTLISTPALGFIISSINIHTWEYCWPKKEIFLPPSKEFKKQYLKMMYEKFPDYSGISLKDGQYKIIDSAEVLINHDILMRKSDDNKEAMAFVARRLDVAYALINGIYSFLWGILLGWLICLYSSFKTAHFPSYPKFLWVLPILIYLLIGYKRANKALKEANDFEKKFLLAKYS